MGVTTTKTNKPFNPRAQDASPLAYNRAALYSGKALDFDGVNDSVSVPTNSAFNFGTENFTLSAYLKITPGGSFSQIFGTKGSTGPDSGYTLYYQYSLGKFLFSNANGSSSSEMYTADSFSEYEGQWIHIAAIRDSSDAKNGLLYINGIKAELASTMTIIDGDNTNPFTVGVATGPNHYGKQQISNVKVFNTALTAAQVADLYNFPEKIVPTGLESNLKLWLPMMEGAGTTAYDGSGNGNHGTISGATYVNGVGAPVAQTSVIDWNKGSNILDNSENFSGWTTQSGTTITSDSIAAPNGLVTADTITSSASAIINQRQVISSMTIGADYVFSVWLKKKSTNTMQIYAFDTAGSSFVSRATINFDSGTITDVDGSGATAESYANDWYRVSIYFNSPSDSISHGIFSDATTAADVYAWGGQSEQSDTLGSYVRTGATAQTSPVLLPQGLTTGRDITGVNLFENVRKQGALNLDGQSWAEVHDNESLDFGTGSFSIEAWAKVKYVNQGSSINAILTLGGNGWSTGHCSLSLNTNLEVYFLYSASVNNSTSTFTEGDWVHIVGVYNETNATIFINGTQKNTAARTAVNITNDLVKYIGRDNQTTRFYNDQIAQPRIYNRALTAEEVQRNYNAGKNIYS